VHDSLPLALMIVLVIALVALVGACFAFAFTRQIARASVAGHVPGAGSLAGGGSADDGKSITYSTGKSAADSDDDRARRLLRMKRELLEQWAKDGKTIDVVTEARAELTALEVDERATAWRDYSAAAANEPLEPERPFAS